MLKRFCLIVAGGSGKRFGTSTPKQFLELQGRPVLMRAADAFLAFDPAIQLIFVLPKDWVEEWNSLCQKHNFDTQHHIAHGGEERFHSVKNGLELVVDEGFVAIHDGARPLVSEACIQETFTIAEESGAAIPVVPVNESIREVTEGTSNPVNRSRFRIVQTPQIFNTEILREAYEQDFNAAFTDDATVVEKLGHEISLSHGHSSNIKITNPQDIKVAEALLMEQ